MKKLIIIPAFNESESIENTIRDIVETVPDFDYIVVNDCSRDNTLDILSSNRYAYLNLPINLINSDWFSKIKAIAQETLIDNKALK